MTDNNQEHRYEHLFDAKVVDQNNDRIGKVEQVYLDDNTGLPTWVTVKTGIFGSKETFVPLERAIISPDEIQVPYEKSFVEDAPNDDPDRHLDSAKEAELYGYYGFDVPAKTDDEILPASQPWTVSGQAGDGVDPEDYGPLRPARPVGGCAHSAHPRDHADDEPRSGGANVPAVRVGWADQGPRPARGSDLSRGRERNRHADYGQAGEVGDERRRRRAAHLHAQQSRHHD